MKLSARRVEEIFQSSLIDEGGRVVEGIVANYRISDSVTDYRTELSEMISELSDNFFEDRGGGWSFLNLCETADGNQWTGQHNVMEMLVVLCVATGLASYLMPREMWSLFPGSVPYIVFKR